MPSKAYRCTRGHLITLNVGEPDPQDWPPGTISFGADHGQDIQPFAGRIFCGPCLREWAERNDIGWIAHPPEKRLDSGGAPPTS